MTSSPQTTTTSQETTSTKKPLERQMPVWNRIWNQTENALHGPYPQRFIAGPNVSQKRGLRDMYAEARNLGLAAPQLSNMAKKVSSGYFLNPENDPTFQGAARAAINPITQQLREQVLPQIVDRSMRTGGVGGGPAAYGGARQDLQEERALNTWEVAAGDITGELANKSRMAGMALIPHAPALQQAANLAFMAPSAAIQAGSALKQQWQQGTLDDRIKDYLFRWTGPQNAANIMQTGGFGTTTGTMTGTMTSPAPDMMTQWLQGLSGAAGGLGSIFGAGGIFPMSDRAMKENIVQIGTSFSGTPIYRFNYKGGSPAFIGMMADEVDPAAVHEQAGIKFVDYVKATEKDVSHD